MKSYTDFSLPFDATWEPDLWGRVRNTVRANVAAAQASAADLQNVRLSEQAELAADYYELRAQDSLKEIFDSTVACYQDAYDMNASLYRSGLGTDEAVAQAEAQLRTAQAQDTNLGILRAQYEHAIAVLIGLAPASFVCRRQTDKQMPRLFLWACLPSFSSVAQISPPRNEQWRRRTRRLAWPSPPIIPT